MKNSILIILVFCFACAGLYKSDNCVYRYTVSIADNVGIDKSEAEAAVSSVLEQSQVSRYSIELLIFGYSSGKEVFTYSEDIPDNVIIKTHPGGIDALVKIRQDNNLYKVFFIKAAGNSKQEILQKLALELRKVLCDF